MTAMSRRAVIVWSILGVLAVVTVGAVRGNGRPRWRPIARGVEFATVRGDPYCRRGSSDIAVLRLDPARVRLRVLHYTRQPDRAPLPIVEWQRRTKALAVFNAGQYFPDLSYMGMLVSDGDAISPRINPRFKAALVAAPSGGGRRARVLDLDLDPIDARAPGWREIAQSFMLFDRTGLVRIRKSDLVANRTIVAEDHDGRILVIVSEGGYTLWDFARLLQHAPLELSHAMSMDGGYEAELCVHAGTFRYASFGQWKGDADEPSAPGAKVPLPAVITVSAE
jgi:hypothetical protein